MRKKEKIDLVKKGSIITAITLISRPLGYIREAVQAYVFGATFLVDAFVVAYNFSDLVQTLFFSGITGSILVPVCSKYLGDDSRYSYVYSTFLNLSLLLTTVFSFVLFLFSERVIELIAPGFSPYARTITRNLFVIMIPIIVMYGALSVMKSFLNAKEHFAAPEASGIVWNLVFILCCLFLSKSLGIYSLAIGATLGSLIQVLLQYPFLRKLNVRYVPKVDLSHESINEAKRLLFGALIGASIVPINSFVDRILGSFLPEGHVASLSYAFRIFILPFSLFAVPVYTVAFSNISRLYHEKAWTPLFSYLDNSLLLLSVTLIPSLFLLCGLSTEIVKLLYERGAFGPEETLLASRALLGYGIGLFFYGLSMLFVRVFNAIHDTKTPAKIGIVSIFLNVILDLVLMVPYKNLGISLATSLVSLYNMLSLFILWRRKTGYRVGKEAIYAIGKSVFTGLFILASIKLTKSLTANPALLITLNATICFLILLILFKDLLIELLKSKF